MNEGQRLLDESKNSRSSNSQSSYGHNMVSAHSLSNQPPRDGDRITMLNKHQRTGASLSYRGPAYMSTSAFQTMAEEIERQKEHSRLSRSASVGGDMVPSALNPVLTGNLKIYTDRYTLF